MKLNEEQQDKLVQELDKKWKNKTCEICGENTWLIDDTVFELREFHGAKTLLGAGAIKPLITIACKSCGNTKVLNAIHLGVIDANNPTRETKEGGWE